MARPPREIVLVDAARTPFGKSGGMYAETRADDLVVRVIRELLRRNPSLPPERIDDVAIAASHSVAPRGFWPGSPSRSRATRSTACVPER